MAKGGGAWKVAYADFVTAMMAFFLVLWLCGQDQSIRRAVSYYFNDPFDASNVGYTKKSQHHGAMNDPPNSGSLPLGESIVLGRGRNPYLVKGENSVCTKLISDWLHVDKAAREHWKEQAQRQRDLVNWTTKDPSKHEATEKTAIRQLAKQMKDELKNQIPPQITGVYRNLLSEVISEVNWMEIAEDLLAP